MPTTHHVSDTAADGAAAVNNRTSNASVIYEDIENITPPPEYTEMSSMDGSAAPAGVGRPATSATAITPAAIAKLTTTSLSTPAAPAPATAVPSGSKIAKDTISPPVPVLDDVPKKQKKEQSSIFTSMLPPGFDADDDDDALSMMSEMNIDDDSLPGDDNFMGVIQRSILGFAASHKNLIWKVILYLVLIGYTVYFGFSIAYSVHGAIALMVFTGLVLLFWGYGVIQDRWGDQIYRAFLKPITDWVELHWNVFRWFVYPALPIGLILYLCYLVREVRQLQSLSGFVFFFFFLWMTSKHPNKVVWRPVLWGYALQFVMAILVLQWNLGYIAVEWLSDYVTKIIVFGFHGAAAVWTDPFMVLHPYVMMGMSLLIYIGALMSILYYYGATQAVAGKMAWIMSATMGTTAIETFGVAANIFLNGMDVMLMLRHYLDKLTLSEMNCFMVGNNATIAGFMFGLLILLGTPAQHLLTAAVMSSPASIAIAKLNYPETRPELSKTKKMEEVRFMKGPEKSLFEAAANGSAVAGKTVLTVIVNYISFMSLLAFLDATLSWLGGMVGYTEVSFEWICSYLCYPIAVLIGVEIKYCREVAKVIGLKIFTTEIYAYQVLGQIYEQGLIDDRSKALGTYALCGFCSLSTIAIALGVWEAICPQRRSLIAKLMFRVMAEANISCFTTACIAGLFYSDNITVIGAESDPVSVVIKLVLGRFPKLFT